MSNSKIFVWLAISFACGVLLASKFDVPREWLYILLGLSAGSFSLMFLGSYKIGALVALFLFAAGLGILRLQVSLVPNGYQDLLDSKQQLEGYVVEDVDVRSNQQLIIFQPKAAAQNILITTTLGQEFFYGDLIVAEGKLQEAKNFGDFDYQKYLQRYNIYATMSYPKLLILKSHQLNPVKEELLKIKQAFTGRVNELLSEPQSALAIGIIIGGHSTLPQTVVNNFNLTGVSHIIAVSGYNITIVVIALAGLAYVAGRRAAFWLTIFGIMAFVVITGASASVVRAGLMGFLLLLALNIGRQYSITPSLFFSGLLMLLFNPKILFWDAGFQLSFAATLGIIYFLPVFERLTKQLPEAFGGKTLILTTLSAILATLPLIVLNFGILSLSAPLVNVLILPTVPLTMLMGFLTVLPLVGPGVALVANWLLLYILKITEVFAHLPYSSLSLQISVWVFWALYAAVFGIYFFLRLLVKRLNKSRHLPTER